MTVLLEEPLPMVSVPLMRLALVTVIVLKVPATVMVPLETDTAATPPPTL